MSQTLMSKYKYIKRVNWPWIEIDDGSKENNSYVINMDDVSAIYTNPKSYYKDGIRFKDGSWLDNFYRDALVELKDLVMTKEKEEEEA